MKAYIKVIVKKDHHYMSIEIGASYSEVRI